LGLVLPDGPPGGEAFLPAFLLLFLPMLVYAVICIALG